MSTPIKAFRQGIFDIVVERGSAMTKRCIDVTGACSYRDGKGNACWVGLLMSDEEATDENGYPHVGGVTTLLRDGFLPARYHGHVDLLTDLQKIHDEYLNWDNVENSNGTTSYGFGTPRKDEIAGQLRAVAVRYGLDANTVDRFYHA